MPGGISVVAALVLLLGAFPQVGHAAPPLPVWDDFHSGFSVGPVASPSKWFYFGTPTLMDGHGPQNKGLAALSSTPGFYYNPTAGAPTPETFVDPQSQAHSRIFGQGAALGVTRPSVGYVPSP